MRKSGFFPRLALVGLARNGRYYGPYLLSCGGVAAMYYILRFLTWNEGLRAVRGAAYLQAMTSIGCFVVALFSLVILLYANGFVMKRRQRELGLYNILGLEKRHIAQVMLWETLLCAAAIIPGGIAAGILLSKLILLLILKLARFPVQFGFSVSGQAALETTELFAALLALTLLCNLIRLGRFKPVDLLHSDRAGEREPKTRWLPALAGTAALAAGYIISAAVKDPAEALILFFLAVLLVMAGTYLLFTAGSIAVLKRLRANKRFYYQTGRFTAVSGLLYRMKQNAVGLANICILSTMVLVTVSTTICLYIGLDNTLNRMFPYDIEVMQDLENQPGDSMAYLERVRRDAAQTGEITELRYYRLYWSICGYRQGVMSLNLDADCVRTRLEVISAEDYARLTGRAVALAPGEALAFVQGLESFPENITVTARFGQEGPSFHIREFLPDYIRHGSTVLISSDEALLFLVTADTAAAEAIADLDTGRSARQFRIQLNLTGFDGEKLRIADDILSRSDGDYGLCSKQDMAVDFYAMYGGFLFLGVFLGLLFLITTVLIIYYKQISEGYEDQRRYQIMRQVGMTDREVRASIHSQILLVFFLPLGTAGLHVLAASPMLCKMLELFQLYDTGLFALCAAGTMLVFCAIYALVYGLTAGAYERIVGGSGGL